MFQNPKIVDLLEIDLRRSFMQNPDEQNAFYTSQVLPVSLCFLFLLNSNQTRLTALYVLLVFFSSKYITRSHNTCPISRIGLYHLIHAKRAIWAGSRFLFLKLDSPGQERRFYLHTRTVFHFEVLTLHPACTLLTRHFPQSFTPQRIIS